MAARKVQLKTAVLVPNKSLERQHNDRLVNDNYEMIRSTTKQKNFQTFYVQQQKNNAER